MKKNVWILNHYAGGMFFEKGGRHYAIAKYMRQDGYRPVIFCCNSKHGKNELHFDDIGLFTVKKDEEIGVPFVFVKGRPYSENGKTRVLNMVDFYFNVQRTAKIYAKKHGKPDVIYASSVHPLTLVAGIKLAKYFGVKCICEVRDLWPESIVAYSAKWTRTNPLMKLLYSGEKWTYKNADTVIMTWPGGYDYIKDQGWQNIIPESKVIHISNGVDMEAYVNNLKENPYEDSDLSDMSYKNFIYTGSIRKVNNLAMLVSAAKLLKEMGNTTARILVFGDGDELESLKNDAVGLNNIVFKGRVQKQSVPSIITQGYASILHNSSTELDKYGQSQNKFFEYLAAGRPILMTYSVGHSVIRNNRCGVELDKQSSDSIAQAIVSLCGATGSEYNDYCKNAAECAKKYDYKELSGKLISVIQQYM